IPSIIICMVMFLFNTSSILNVYAQHSGAATSGSAVGQGATSGAATSGSAVGQGATSGAATSGNATSGNASLTSNGTSVSHKPSSPF
ncbi:MAG: hypothetical protein WAM14_22490, partial [Candidatus Nitrosopolaris sp.]